MHHIKIPLNATQKIQPWGEFEPPWIMLDGRLQYLTKSRTLVFLPEQPPFGPIGQYGAWKDVWMLAPGLSSAWEGLEARWVSLRNIPNHFTQGWRVFYGEDGLYLRNPDGTGDLILMCKQS